MKKKKIVDLIIAEKVKAAERIAAVLSNSKYREKKVNRVRIFEFNQKGKQVIVIGLKGHLFTTEFSKKVHEAGWRNTDPLFLLTKAPLMKIPRPESRNVIRVLKDLAKRANRVIIATDYDREGENIGMQASKLVINKVRPRISVKRAIFNSLARKEIERAFREDNLGDLNENMIAASEVRQEIDLRMGVSFTRLATMAVQDVLGTMDTGLISLGPCQTPTLGLIVKRYLDHLQSVELSKKNVKYRVRLIADANGKRIEFLSKKEFDKEKEAIDFGRKLINKELEIEKIQKKIKNVNKPLPLNTPRLASLASRELKISSKKALDIAEKLYLEGLITYPRTETDRYKGPEIGIAKKLAEEIREKKILHFSSEVIGPRNGKSDDMAHPPIRPERIVHFDMIPKILKSDGKLASKMYELIVRHFLANLLEDAKVEEITVLARVDGNFFEKNLKKVLRKGFLEVYPYHELHGSLKKETRIDLTEGIKLKIIAFRIEEIRPKIIHPISESELVRLMDKLGIGTDATFADHIHKNIERRYVERRGGRLVPTRLGLALYDSLNKSAPEILDPSIRSKMEKWFAEVEKGRKTPREVVKEAKKIFKEIFIRFRENINDFAQTLARAIQAMENMRVRRKRKKKSVKKHRKRRR